LDHRSKPKSMCLQAWIRRGCAWTTLTAAAICRCRSLLSNTRGLTRHVSVAR
jgi:hypothetical protein